MRLGARSWRLAASLIAVAFVGVALRRDLGYSPVSGVDVGTVVGERLLESLALAAAAAAIGMALFAMRPRCRQGSGAAPAPSAVPAALWVLPLFGAVGVAWEFGGIPTVGPHSAIVARFAATLLPAAALGVAFAVWTAVARRTSRDVLVALLVGTLVTDAVFGLPALGTLIVTAATRPDRLMVRGALFAVAAIAVVAEVTFVPAARALDELHGGRSNLRRAANGVVAAIWVVALVAATLGRSAFGVGRAARAGTRIATGVSATHPFGTDVLGRDVLVRVLATARGSLLLVVAATLVALVLGAAIGAVVAFARGRTERVGLAALAGWAAFPGEIVAVAFLTLNGRRGSQAALALAFVAAPSIAAGAQRRVADAVRRSDARLSSGAWLRDVGARAVPGLFPAALATMFAGASRVVIAELVAGLLGAGPAATQTWSHEVVMQLPFASHAPFAVLAPVSVAFVTAVALAGLGNAIRPTRNGGSAARETENPLRKDVLVDLRGAPRDRERA